MTSFVNSHDCHVVMVCLNKKMDHFPFNMTNSGSRLIPDCFCILYPLEGVSTLQNMAAGSMSM